MFNKINKHKFWIAGGLIMILGLLFLGIMLRFIGFGVKKEPEGTLFQVAKRYYLDGGYKKAVSSYEKLLILEPDNPEAVLDLAIIYDDYLNMDDKAIELYKRYTALPIHSDKKKMVEGWIKETANESLGIKTDKETEKIKQLEKDLEAAKKENEQLKKEVEALSGRLFNIQSDNEKEIKKLQMECDKLSSDLTTAKVRAGKLSNALSISEGNKKELIDKLEEALKNKKQDKIEQLKAKIQKQADSNLLPDRKENE